MHSPSREEVEDVNYIGGQNKGYNNNFRPNQGTNKFNNFNSNCPHSNLSYSNTNTVLQPPAGFSVTNGMIDEPTKGSTDDILRAFMADTKKYMGASNKRIDSLEASMSPLGTSVTGMSKQIQMIETQISQLADNLIQRNEQLKVVHRMEETSQQEGCDADNIQRTAVSVPSGPPPPLQQRETTQSIPTPVLSNELPIPDCQVHTNLTLLDTLQEIPKYAAALKEAVTHERRMTKHEDVQMALHCTEIIQKKRAVKERDPGQFIIYCSIGDNQASKALCDLGASVNVMPLAYFDKLRI